MEVGNGRSGLDWDGDRLVVDVDLDSDSDLGIWNRAGDCRAVRGAGVVVCHMGEEEAGDICWFVLTEGGE